MAEPVRPKPWSEFCGGKWYRWLMFPELLAEWFLYLLQRFALIKLTIQGVVAASVIIGFIIFLRETELREVEREDRRQDRAVRKTEMMIAIIESNANTKEGEPSEAIPILEAIVAGGIDLSGLSLQGANLEGANLEGAKLRDANLQGVNLGESLKGGYRYRVNLKGADLAGANLESADLSNAELNGAILGAANLACSDLSNANLQNAILTSANLHGANLTRANLTRATFYGADLTDANLNGAKREGAKLDGAFYDMYPWILPEDHYFPPCARDKP